MKATWWPNSTVGRIVALTLSAIVVGLWAILLLAAGKATDPSSFSALAAHASLVGCSAFAVGIIVGFLFGIPQQVGVASTSKSETSNVPGTTFRPSTQLQQIADWLTKVLLGASLTQLGNLKVIGQYFGEPFGSDSVAMALVIYFFVVGALGGYLLMITYLGRLIRDAGEDLLADRNRILVAYNLYDALYKSPAILDTAVTKAKEYLDDNQTSLNADADRAAEIYGHLACAYGQQFKRNIDQGGQPDGEVAKDLRKLALECAEKAVSFNCEWGKLFAEFYDADDDALDDDWVVFKTPANDPELKIKAFVDRNRRE